MPPFAKMTAEQQQLEGVFRSHHNRILNHSEEIAFYKGSERENEIIDESFSNIEVIIFCRRWRILELELILFVET